MWYQTVHTATDTQQYKYFLVDDVVGGGGVVHSGTYKGDCTRVTYYQNFLL